MMKLRLEKGLEGVALVTMDIENMYNNIPETLGLEAVQSFLNSRIRQTDPTDAYRDPEVSTSSLLKGLKFVLQSNYFTFNGKTYRQRQVLNLPPIFLHSCR